MIHQNVTQIEARIDGDSLDAVAAAEVVERRLVPSHGIEVSAADVLGLSEVFAHLFETEELHHPLELERPLVVMQDVKQHDLMAVVAHPLQGRFEGLQIGEEVAEDHHDLAATHPPGDLGQAVGHVRLLDRRDLIEMMRHPVNLRHRVPRRHIAPHAVIKRGERHLVVLPHDGIAQRRCGLSRIEQLLLGRVSVPHRRTDIEHQVADEIRLHLILLDREPVPFVVQAPVDVLRIVTDHVIAVPGKLDGKPRQRRLVGPGQIAKHQPARLDSPVGNSAENFRVEVTGEDGSGHVLVSGSLYSSSVLSPRPGFAGRGLG